MVFIRSGSIFPSSSMLLFVLAAAIRPSIVITTGFLLLLSMALYEGKFIFTQVSKSWQ
jgi:hypothetical protein